MPTRARQKWAAEAVEMFRQQTYGPKELVVIDDASDPSFPSGLYGGDIRYRMHQLPMTVGAKRNKACEAAQGDIIMHWDSDDIYSADRMEHQVKMLLGSGAEIVGYNSAIFLNADTGERHRFNGSSLQVLGASLCYWKRVWGEALFQDIDTGEDHAFSITRQLFTGPAEGRLIARTHKGNTSPRWPGMSNTETWERVDGVGGAI